MLLTPLGKIIDGNEAGRIGLVSKVVPREEVVKVAQDMAVHIAENCSPIAVRATVKTLRCDLGWREWRCGTESCASLSSVPLLPTARIKILV